jgi:preprotein translocase subunit SecG
MVTSLMVFQAIVSILLILLVLLQFGKGAEAGLMTSASDSVMTTGQQGNILSKITIVLAILFIGNSLLLAKVQSNNSGKSLMDKVAPKAIPFNSTQAKKAEAPATTKKAEPAKADKK